MIFGLKPLNLEVTKKQTQLQKKKELVNQFFITIANSCKFLLNFVGGGNHRETQKVLTIIPLKLRFYAGMQRATKHLPSSPKDPNTSICSVLCSGISKDLFLMEINSLKYFPVQFAHLKKKWRIRLLFPVS